MQVMDRPLDFKTCIGACIVILAGLGVHHASRYRSGSASLHTTQIASAVCVCSVEQKKNFSPFSNALIFLVLHLLLPACLERILLGGVVMIRCLMLEMNQWSTWLVHKHSLYCLPTPHKLLILLVMHAALGCNQICCHAGPLQHQVRTS